MNSLIKSISAVRVPGHNHTVRVRLKDGTEATGSRPVYSLHQAQLYADNVAFDLADATQKEITDYLSAI